MADIIRVGLTFAVFASAAAVFVTGVVCARKKKWTGDAMSFGRVLVVLLASTAGMLVGWEFSGSAAAQIVIYAFVFGQLLQVVLYLIRPAARLGRWRVVDFAPGLYAFILALLMSTLPWFGWMRDGFW